MSVCVCLCLSLSLCVCVHPFSKIPRLIRRLKCDYWWEQWESVHPGNRLLFWFMSRSPYLKFRKHQSLVQQISGSGYKRQFFRIVGFSEMKAKHLAKYCSIVFIIESRHIWRRRCRVYPLDLLCCCLITADSVTCLNQV